VISALLTSKPFVSTMSRTFYALPYMIREWVEITRLESLERADNGFTAEYQRLQHWGDFWEEQIKRLTGVKISRSKWSYPMEDDERFTRRFVMDRMNSLAIQAAHPELRNQVEDLPSSSAVGRAAPGRKRARREIG
jgi:hypothetical protein